MEARANDHINFIHFVSHVFGNSIANVVALIGDHCFTTKSVSLKTNIPMTGCHSHRLDLVVTGIVGDRKEILNVVRCILQKLTAPVPGPKVRQVCTLKAKEDNATRRSSTFQILQRYTVLFDALPSLECEEIQNLKPSTRNYACIDSLLLDSGVEELDSVTKYLQPDVASILESRFLSGDILQFFGRHPRGCARTQRLWTMENSSRRL